MLTNVFNPKEITGAPISWLLGGNPLLEGVWFFANGVVCIQTSYDLFMIALEDQDDIHSVFFSLNEVAKTSIEMILRRRKVILRDRCVTLRRRCATLRDRCVTLRDRWATLLLTLFLKSPVFIIQKTSNFKNIKYFYSLDKKHCPRSSWFHLSWSITNGLPTRQAILFFQIIITNQMSHITNHISNFSSQFF